MKNLKKWKNLPYGIKKARINPKERKCHYCEITEENLKKLFDNKVIQSKKPSFNSTLQIERLNPNKGYVEDNCVLACCICNNAKSDMINAKNFKEYFVESVKKFYNDLLNGKTNSFS